MVSLRYLSRKEYYFGINSQVRFVLGHDMVMKTCQNHATSHLSLNPLQRSNREIVLQFCLKIDWLKNHQFSKAIAFAFCQKSMGPKIINFLRL